jgi:ParB/RepB/Spo0J family partition protein
MTQLVEADMKIEHPRMDDIFCDDDFNCRGAIAPIDVLDLSKSIDKIGLQQPITIQPWDKQPGKKYRIISGHRRFQAYRLLQPKRDTIPAIINRSPMDELTARKLNFEENLKRKDLNILQESRALIPFDRAGWTQEQIASELSMSKGWVQARLALLKLPDEIQQVAAAGLLTQEHIKQLASMKSKQQQFEAVKKIKEAKLAGEKKKIEVVKKKRDVLAKKKREPQEIFDMIEMISKAIGFGFYTRCLAWSAGEISDFELMRDLRDEASKRGIKWEIPADIIKDAKVF